MKILLLADIHANWPALSAIDEDFDVCLFLGDAVDYAATPGPCIDWLRKNATYGIRGNHDHAVAQRVDVRPAGAFRRLAAGLRPHHYASLTDQQLTWLAELPVTQYVTLGSHSFLLVHGTPRDPMDEYLTDDSQQWAIRLEHIDVDFVCVGHTHLPMLVQLQNTWVINPGSVGQPRDGDPRACYAVIENGEVTFHRVRYDVERAVQDLIDANLPEDITEMATAVLRSGGNPEVAPNI